MNRFNKGPITIEIRIPPLVNKSGTMSRLSQKLMLLAATSMEEKIGHLERLAEHPNTPHHEADTARKKAIELRNKYNIPKEEHTPKYNREADKPEEENPSNYGLHSFVHEDGRKGTASVNPYHTITVHDDEYRKTHTKTHPNLDSAAEFFKRKGFSYQHHIYKSEF